MENTSMDRVKNSSENLCQWFKIFSHFEKAEKYFIFQKYP